MARLGGTKGSMRVHADTQTSEMLSTDDGPRTHVRTLGALRPVPAAPAIAGEAAEVVSLDAHRRARRARLLARAARTPITAEAPMLPPCVLVISTSGLVRARVRRELSPRGFSVVEAEGSLAVAPQAVRTNRPDVVLVDDAPESDFGARLVRALKGDPASHAVPVLLFSDDSPERRSAVLRLGADGVVSRSPDFDALAATISLHLKG
jgi:PleD family two-component response regulator